MTHTEPKEPTTTINLEVDSLGPTTKASPLELSTEFDDDIANFTPDGLRIVFDPAVGEGRLDDIDQGITLSGPAAFELAGPKQRTYFAGQKVTAGIVTCGGLCPGLNNIVRGVVLTLWHHYDVRRIFGFRYGYRGLAPFTPDPPLELKPEHVAHIHRVGGTMLGSSRGPQDPATMVDTLVRHGIDMLFVAGGDGGMRGAQALYEEIKARGLKIAVVGVPKTIDNDLPFIERTFGFDTAVSVAVDAISAAHVEAVGAPAGVGLVKLMGRHSGFVASAATLASREANLVLVPEIAFRLEGERGVYAWLRNRLAERGHAVVVVAEGAGQDLLRESGDHDASGNAKLGDIGVFLRDAIKREFATEELNLKYIDPSYIIRAAPANSADAIFCGRLAEDAVHAAMAGKTGLIVGLWMNRFTHVPLAAVTSQRKTLSPDSQFWRNVVDCTGQPAVLR
ncbi:MAG: ATP-dependent 6-phosphofructokinase [Deltaproteobacteria bacterium]|nr:ATP-dependent 6-phosphofructokinase [Deltaproteobacteria bacterium]